MVTLEVNTCGGLSQLPVVGSEALGVVTSGELDPKRNALWTRGNREALEGSDQRATSLKPRSHRNFRLVLIIKLLEIMLKTDVGPSLLTL